MIETRKNERRAVTADPKMMLNMYLVKTLCRTWKEDFIDEDTGEVTSIERNEVLYQKGTLIDQDVLVQIRFHMQAGEIQEVEVSDQCRMAYEAESNYLHPYTAQIEMPNKKYKFLFYACDFNTALDILRDYVELNYRDPFTILFIREFDSCVILTDTLKELRIDPPSGDIPFEEYSADEEQDNGDSEKQDEKDKKFYQIETRISYENEDGGDEFTQQFVVHTFNTDRAMMLISACLLDKETARRKTLEDNGKEYHKNTYHPMIESAKILPIGCFIPKEFSEAYIK